MTAKTYFEGIRRAQERANQLEETAKLMGEHLGDAKGMRYDTVGCGHGKNGYTPADAISQSIIKLENAQKRAYDARENAMSRVAEAYDVIGEMLADDKADVPAIKVLTYYYLECRQEKDIAKAMYTTQSNIAKIKSRGLRKSERYLQRYALI